MNGGAEVRAEHLELLLPKGRIPLGFVADRGTILLVARDRAARWPTEILRSGLATVRIGDAVVTGAAQLLTDPGEKALALERFRSKYGPEDYLRWYDRPARIVRVRTEGPSPPSPNANYYDWLQAEFDNVAEDYDRHITGNRVNRLLRDRSLAQLRTTFARSHALLELGCGSGMETLPLLSEGHELLCVDISERMLEVVRTKARQAGVAERLRTRKMRVSELPGLAKEFGPASFDGGYSTYGALNCEEDLSELPPALYGLLGGEARFVSGVYNRWCLFELLGYGLTGQFGRAFGRRSRPIQVGRSRFCVDVFSHSPREFRELFSPGFSVERVEGVPVLIPPSDLSDYAERFSRHFELLARWDRRLGERWPFGAFGDHFLMTLRREPESPFLHRAA